MAVRTVQELHSQLSTGGSRANDIETRLVVDLIDTLVDMINSVGGNVTAILSALPTTDPGSPGELWNDNGVLKVSV